MRSSPSSFRLTFVLPTAARTARSGVYPGWVPGCELAIAGPFVAITGPSRERAMEQAARFLRVTCQGLPALSIDTVLESPLPVSGRDGWNIIVGADIAFSPTSLPPHFPDTAHATPALVR